VAILLVVLLSGLIVAGVYVQSQRVSPASVRAWSSDGGWERWVALQEDLNALRDAETEASVRVAAVKLQADVQAARQFNHLPAARAQREWSQALSDLTRYGDLIVSPALAVWNQADQFKDSAHRHLLALAHMSE
jgi:hypothetical protein